MLENVLKRVRRHKKIRSKIIWTSTTPRLAVYRSNTSIYAQLIDDKKWITICSASDMKMTKEWTKIDMAKKVWAEIAKLALSKKIENVVFDRGWFLYHWRVKAFADSAREAWLNF